MLTAGWARRIALCLLVLQGAVSTGMYGMVFSGLSGADAVWQTGDLRPQIAPVALWLMLAALSHLPGALRMKVGLHCLPADLRSGSTKWAQRPGSRH